MEVKKIRPGVVLEEKGTYEGYNYFIVFTFNGYRCAYVEIPKDSKYYKVDYEELDIDAHGGITFSEYYPELTGSSNEDDKWYIGWDYGHFSDRTSVELVEEYFPDEEVLEFTKTCDRPTFNTNSLDDVIEECKYVINQLKEKR